MSRLSVALDNDLKLLNLLHDELALHAHLLKADLKAKWDELEAKWADLKEHLARVKVASGDAGRKLESAIKPLIEALRTGYTGIANAMKS